MVAIAHPSPHQLSYLDAPPAPSAFDVLRLSWHIRRLHYGDALVSGMWRLERQCFQRIASLENDAAKDGTLVTGSYVEYVLFTAGRVMGAVEVRTEDGTRISGIHDALARYLLEAGWQLSATRLAVCGAIASPGMRLDRVRRLLKAK